MNRWIIRMAGILMLLLFMLVFLQLYKQLVQLQRAQDKPPATATTN